MQLKYFVHNTDCLQTFLLVLQFILLSLQRLVYNSVQRLLVCNLWCWVQLLVCSLWRNAGKSGQQVSDQYCPRSILVSPPPAWLHSTRTRAIRSFIALAWGGHDLVHNVRIVPPNPRGDENTEKYCPRPEGPRAIFLRITIFSWIGGYNTDIMY